MSALAWVSTVLWWVLASSALALPVALVASLVLRWAEHSGIVFNRVYFACLLWTLAGAALFAVIAARAGHLRPPYAVLLRMPSLRIAWVVDMLLGALLLWRLVPRVDAHRVRPGSACLAAAVAIGIAFGVATSLA